MKKSEKYQLNLPEGSDPYDVEHMNANQGETTANIPTDAPLYEGDYLEVYADGSG